MSNARGFTLVEVMVVLVVMSVTVGLATLGFQRLENDQLETTAGRVTGWIQNISDAAVLDGAVYGISFDPQEKVMHTYYYLDYRWWIIEDEDFISPDISENVTIYSEKGKSWIVANAPTQAGFRPQMIFLPVGSSLPEQFYLEDQLTQRTAKVNRDQDGFFTWQLI